MKVIIIFENSLFVKLLNIFFEILFLLFFCVIKYNRDLNVFLVYFSLFKVKLIDCN